MTVAFSVLSWNVKKFGTRGTAHTNRIINEVLGRDPSLVAFYETKPAALWRRLMEGMPTYSWHITEGKQTQEILLGVRSGVRAFVTQRTEFKTRDAYYRPGLLCSVRSGTEIYPVLFLHLASFPDPKGFGRRQEQVDAAFDFRDTLNTAIGGNSKYIFLGDLNTMGLDFKYDQDTPGATYDRVRVTADQELSRVDLLAGRSDMRRLSKTHDQTWRNAGNKRGNLDHVVAADHLTFTQHGPNNDLDVLVSGWPELPVGQQANWLTRFSDHAYMYFEVEDV